VSLSAIPCSSLPTAYSTFNPYPSHYSATFAFSSIPYPLPHQSASRRFYFFPEGDIGLTPFRTSTLLRDLDAIIPPRSSLFARATIEFPDRPLCLLAQAYQPLWLVLNDDGY
jgi:hypothetical protein